MGVNFFFWGGEGVETLEKQGPKIAGKSDEELR